MSGGAGHRPDDVGGGFAALLARLRADTALPAAVMGIINVTPDSFSDDGLFADTEAAIAHGRRLVAEGAAIVDIGGESTRGGAAAVDEAEEKRRVLPVIEALRETGALISIDTMKAGVAAAAIAAGAHIVNDVRGLQGDADIATVAARYGAGLAIMHNPGVLGSAKPLEGDPIAACLTFFERSLAVAAQAGVPGDKIVLDPGFGFGKSVEQNVALIARLPELSALGLPLLVGTSRKSFIGKVSGGETKERLAGTIAANVAAALFGAAIVRVHDVAPHVEALKMVAAIRAAGAARQVTEAVLGLGGNLGDRRAFLAGAVAAIAAHPQIGIVGVSPLYETPPWGRTDQPAFLNAALKVATELSPRALLEAVLAVEAGLGRERNQRWGPRVVDIDILVYGEATVDEPGLRVPHPRLGERAFALQPLVDLAPDARLFGRPARDMLAELDVAGMRRVAPPGWENSA